MTGCRGRSGVGYIRIGVERVVGFGEGVGVGAEVESVRLGIKVIVGVGRGVDVVVGIGSGLGMVVLKEFVLVWVWGLLVWTLE